MPAPAPREDEEGQGTPHGHVTSLAVLRSHRKLGLATKLMQASMRAMVEVYEAVFCSLHVRESNYAAFHLYKDTLGFRVNEVEKGYYADGEDAYGMRRDINRIVMDLPPVIKVPAVGARPVLMEEVWASMRAESAAAEADAAASDAAPAAGSGEAPTAEVPPSSAAAAPVAPAGVAEASAAGTDAAT